MKPSRACSALHVQPSDRAQEQVFFLRQSRGFSGLRPDHSRERILTRAKPLALLSISEAFNPIYAVLWEAPIAALELTDSAGTPGIPVVRLHPIYEVAATRLLVSQKFMTAVVFCGGFNSWKRHGSSHGIATK